jgi:hypothetical protein
VDAHREAIAEAMAFIEQEAAYTRSGYHGKTAGGQSVGRFDEATGLVWTRWDHSTNRNQEPQLHTHVAVLNRVIERRSRNIQALDGKGFKAIKFGAVAIYDRTLETRLAARLGVVMAMRPDGKAREILGVDQQLCAEASSRARQVEANLDARIEEFRQRQGREPSPAERKSMWVWRRWRTAPVRPGTSPRPGSSTTGPGRAWRLSATWSSMLPHTPSKYGGTGIPTSTDTRTAPAKRPCRPPSTPCRPATRRPTHRRGDSDRPGAVTSSPVGGMTALLACSRTLRGARE